MGVKLRLRLRVEVSIGGGWGGVGWGGVMWARGVPVFQACMAVVFIHTIDPRRFGVEYAPSLLDHGP